MSPQIEHLKQEFLRLPPTEQVELSEWIEEHKPNSSELTAHGLIADSNDEAAFRWINDHGSDYPGQWLALDGDRLLAHGADLSEVAAVARAKGIDFPLLHLVEPPGEHPYIRS